MKIAYLISQYPAVSHTFILREVLRLRKLGISVHTASINKPDRSGDKLTTEERNEVEETYYIKSKGFLQIISSVFVTFITHPIQFFQGLWFAIRLGRLDLRRILWGVFYFIEAVMVGQWMKRLNLNHLHTHFGNPASTVALIMNRTFSYSFSLTVHGPDVFYDTTLNYLQEKILGAKFIVCISHYARSQLMRLSPANQWDKLLVCPLGISPKTYTPVVNKNPSNTTRLLCVGRLVPSKGQHLLLKALSNLINEGYSVELELVGDGPDRRSLEKEALDRKIESQVIFRGALNEIETHEALKNADIFVLASFAEGLPVSLMEAMSMEIPCISTQITGIPELINDGVEGLLVSPSSVKKLTKMIAKLVKNQDLQVKMGQAGRSRILQDYDLEKNTQKLADIFTHSLKDNVNTRN